MNSFNAIGRVGKDALTRFTQGGDPVTGWSLAVDSGYGDKKVTLWLDCSLWGKRGEKVAEYITKGSQLGVSGELGTREHDGKTYLTLRVSEVSLIGGKSEGTSSTGSRGGTPQRERPTKATDAPRDDFVEDDIPFAHNRSVW
jgi:single-strand DNA-binding protein